MPIPCVHSANTVYDTPYNKVSYSSRKGLYSKEKGFAGQWLKNRAQTSAPIFFYNLFHSHLQSPEDFRTKIRLTLMIYRFFFKVDITVATVYNSSLTNDRGYTLCIAQCISV